VKVSETPDGIALISDAVHGIDSLKAREEVQRTAVAEARAVLEEREAELTKTAKQRLAAEDRLRALIASGACAADCGHDHGQAKVQAPDIGKSNGVNGVSHSKSNGTHAPSPKPLIALDDEDHPIVWRIAFMLYANPVLDYRATADALWGPGLSPAKLKNRIGAHLTHLKTLGVVKSVGNNRYEVNAAKLAEHSGMPVEATS
jgi:hypothetical protein